MQRQIGGVRPSLGAGPDSRQLWEFGMAQNCAMHHGQDAGSFSHIYIGGIFRRSRCGEVLNLHPIGRWGSQLLGHITQRQHLPSIGRLVWLHARTGQA